MTRLRQVGGALLVSCYELGHQPLSLASPLAALEAAGFRPRAIDTSVDPLDPLAVRDAHLVAIAVPMHTALRLGQDVAREVRALNPGAHISFYGLYAWLNADYLFEAGLADSVIGGEYEQPLVRLAEALDSDLPLLPRRVPGLRLAGEAAPEPGGAIRTMDGHMPARAQLPDLGRYAHLLRDGHEAAAGYVEATRGCKHTCRHCPITPVYGGRFVAVPREVVLADIRAQADAGAKHITFGDPDFLNGPTHSLRILRQMHAEFPALTFDATIKVEHILRHAALLPELRELGCVFVVSAVESLSDRVLEHLAKGHTAEDVDRAFDVMAGAGIPLRPTFVAFTPWTALDDYLHLLHYVHNRGLVHAVDPVQYAIRLLIPPRSALLEDAAGTPWLGELDREAFSYRWTHPDPRMDVLHAEVAAIVECGALDCADPFDTFEAVLSAACRIARVEVPPLARPSSEGHPPPRLNESWFC